jgi:hypothetical protein
MSPPSLLTDQDALKAGHGCIRDGAQEDGPYTLAMPAQELLGAPRRSVRRASGFALTGQPSITS